MKLRGYLALVVICLGLLAADVVQRLVIAPWVKLRPGRRISVLGTWQDVLAWWVMTIASRVGGASMPSRPSVRVPAEPGHLILMNHQSLFDIPLVVGAVEGGYPRIVTRQRYSRFIPLISHMIRLYQYPVVDPTANKATLARTLDELEIVGRASDVPIALFPEGSRSRDGSIGRFRLGGLSRLLAVRPWEVHVYVGDGFWEAATFDDLADGVPRLRGSFLHAGTFQWTDPTADSASFIEQARQLMIDALDELRGARSAL